MLPVLLKINKIGMFKQTNNTNDITISFCSCLLFTQYILFDLKNEAV